MGLIEREINIGRLTIKNHDEPNRFKDYLLETGNDYIRHITSFEK